MTAPSIQPDPTTKILQRFLEISPLSGDYSLIDEYINVLDKLAAQDAASGALLKAFPPKRSSILPPLLKLVLRVFRLTWQL
jgi:hypothetical protein